MRPLYEQIQKRPVLGWILFLGTAVIVFLLGLLASSIIERRTEAEFAYTPRLNHSQFEPRNEIWGENFPRQYQSFLKTSDTSFLSKHNGSATIDMLETDPRLVVLWAGYGFSRDYIQARGHYYSIHDIRTTLRTGAPKEGRPSPQPNTCWTCKSPDVPRLIDQLGESKFYEGSWDTKGHEVVNAIGCGDCHDAKTMNLHISRPSLKDACDAADINLRTASHQEMRSLVCAQCHVEYYFDTSRKDAKGISWLTYPWKRGLSAEAMEAYYDSIGFSDWTHSISRAPMLKAQHPDYELYLTGVHANRGVSCADCHMPYLSEGGQKFTSHHVVSPLRNVSISCQVCHREETENIVRDVYERQDKLIQNRNKLEELLVRAHVEAKKAWDLGASETQMKNILQSIRHAQWRWDFIAASHGAAFHSPVESARIIASAIDIAQEARIELARVLAGLGYNNPVPYPEISTKKKAQEYIGLEMQRLVQDKKEFLENVLPLWLENAENRENQYPVEIIN